MKKADKIKICKDFQKGKSLYGMWYWRNCAGQYCHFRDVEKALRYGLRHPEELKGEK